MSFKASWYWRGGFVVFVLALVGGLVVVLARGEGAEKSAVVKIEEVERKGLYEDLLRSTTSLCKRAETDSALLDRCADSAHFLLAFPECGENCKVLAREHRRGPTR